MVYTINNDMVTIKPNNIYLALNTARSLQTPYTHE